MNEEPREAARRKSRRLAGLNPAAPPSPAHPSGSQSADEVGPAGASSPRVAHGGTARPGSFRAKRRGPLVRPSPYARRAPPTLTPQRRATAPRPSPPAGEPAVVVSHPDSDDGLLPSPSEVEDSRPHTVVAGATPPVGAGAGEVRARRGSERSVPGAVQGESFCRCTQQSLTRDLQCSCGEEQDAACEWTWDTVNKSAAAEVQRDGRHVRFHVHYSSGTAAARGALPLTHRQHFWEVKMTTPVYGTDMMVGVGTDEVDLDAHRYNFCSLLGRDKQSWGLSYYGKTQHGGALSEVGRARFGQGSIIGLHLDTWRGTLTFYKNRQPLGVTLTGLRGKVLYPMVSSTAARTAMRLVRACSYTSSLEFECCSALRRAIPPHLDVTRALPLPPGLHGFLTNNLSWLLRSNELAGGSSADSNLGRTEFSAQRSDGESTAEERGGLEPPCSRSAESVAGPSFGGDGGEGSGGGVYWSVAQVPRMSSASDESEFERPVKRARRRGEESSSGEEG